MTLMDKELGGGALEAAAAEAARVQQQLLERENREAAEHGREIRQASRADWPEYFMNIARTVATRSTCDRRHVGAVIVRDKNILSTGYNGAIRGQPHCDEVGHDERDGRCTRAVHAEANAILQAARNGVRIEGSDLYTTASPCWECFKLIANAGIARVFFQDFYREPRSFEVAHNMGLELLRIEPDAAAPTGGH